MADGENMLTALLDNRSANFARRKKMQAQTSQEELNATLGRLEGQREAILANEGGYSPELVSQFLSDLDKNIAFAKAKFAPPNMVETIASQTLGGQALSDILTPADADQKTFERNNALASLVPAVASLSPRGIATLPGRAMKSAGRTLGGAAKRVASVGGTEASALTQGERLSGAALKSTAKAGATATREEMAAAAPYIAQAGGDFEAGMRAYKAAQSRAGKNVANPSASRAAPSPSSTPLPQGAGMGNVPPRGASAPASAPAAPVPPNVTAPSSSTLKTFLAGAGGALTGAQLASGIMDLLGSAEGQAMAEQSVLGAQPKQGLPTELMPQQVTPQQAQQPAPQAVATESAPQQDNSLNDLISKLLLGTGEAQPQATQQGLISDVDIQQIQKLLTAINPQQQQVATEQPELSKFAKLMEAVGKGLVVGGTGDTSMMFGPERNAREQALAEESLRRSRQEFTPQQQFLNQMLAQVLGNRLNVSGQKEVNTAQNQAALQQQSRQIATQMLLLEREQQNALSRNDRQYAQQLELQKREMAARLEQIKAQTTGQLEFMMNPEIQKLLSGMGGLGGGNNQPIVNQ